MMPAQALIMELMSGGRYRVSEDSLLKEVKMEKRELGDEHPSTLTSMANLVLTHNNQRRWKKAEDSEVQVMEMRKRVLGDDYPNTLASMANPAFTFKV
ncbi:hypothetical protein DM02DRAFT_343885 [Periconia macrospinosa]|uniref:Kinesin light chain n=1 Tax=Periconia macrospinosa TaxID=97972 RepID=A0A2V1D094_9PLEO|nr:hypothetical protein DM02DRAFT_343885 [Periconia macrospinosa]